MSLDPVRRLLLDKGFKQYHHNNNLSNEPREYWSKRYKDARRCEGNCEREGIQVVVWLHEIPFTQVVHRSVEVEVTGEYDGEWYKMQAYSMLPDAFLLAHETIIARLLRAWEGLSL